MDGSLACGIGDSHQIEGVRLVAFDMSPLVCCFANVLSLELGLEGGPCFSNYETCIQNSFIVFYVSELSLRITCQRLQLYSFLFFSALRSHFLLPF